MKTTGRLLIIFTLLALPGLTLNAQIQNRADRLNAQKVAFFTERLNLTPDEAQHFWPVYNQYQEKKSAINQAKAAILREVTANYQTMGDEKLTNLSDKYIDYDLQLAQLQATYHKEFKKVLPIQKVIKLYQTERQFTAFLLRQIQNRRGNTLPDRRF